MGDGRETGVWDGYGVGVGLGLGLGVGVGVTFFELELGFLELEVGFFVGFGLGGAFEVRGGGAFTSRLSQLTV